MARVNQHNRTKPCINDSCQFTKDTCNFAHTINEWICPDALMCCFGEECYKVGCCRLHKNTLEQKRIVATYIKIVFKKPYEKLFPNKNNIVINPVRIPVPVQVRIPAPVVVVEEKIEEVLLKKKQDIKNEYEIAKNNLRAIELKMKHFREVASNYFDVGSKELEF
jgi:hypothetical protein